MSVPVHERPIGKSQWTARSAWGPSFAFIPPRSSRRVHPAAFIPPRSSRRAQPAEFISPCSTRRAQPAVLNRPTKCSYALSNADTDSWFERFGDVEKFPSEHREEVIGGEHPDESFFAIDDRETSQLMTAEILRGVENALIVPDGDYFFGHDGFDGRIGRSIAGYDFGCHVAIGQDPDDPIVIDHDHGTDIPIAHFFYRHTNRLLRLDGYHFTAKQLAQHHDRHSS
jgi:hypothetical protein